MVYQFGDSAQLPLVGNKGDIAIVDDGVNKRTYHWNLCWRHERDYVCPVKAKDVYHEPNV